jgi:signal transduction histidine kinase
MNYAAAVSTIRRFQPRGLAGRLLLAILAALALVQLALALVLQERKNAQVRDVIERQAMVQTVMATQLLRKTPAADAITILDTFKSASSCGSVIPAPPDMAISDHGEDDFATMLRARLGDTSGPLPRVKISRLEHEGDSFLCSQLIGAEGLESHGWPLQVTSYVPLAEGRWLQFTSLVDFPATENLQIAFMFLLASMAVGAVAVLSVRTQTRSLAALAEASEKLGRGETVAPLAENGPVEVATAAHAFNTMQGRLKNFMDDRLKMLAAISHDLRTPLTTMRLKAEFVRDKSARQGLIDTIDEMTVITEASLAFTRAEATQEPTKRIELANLLKQLRDEYATKGMKVGLVQRATPASHVREVALKRALRNLIDNALRYGGSADLTLDQSAGAAVLSVDDTGSGITESQLERVFEPFVRLEDSRSKDTGGIGMGLAIARSIVKAHGGEIRLLNRSEGGLRAEIHLPSI